MSPSTPNDHPEEARTTEASSALVTKSTRSFLAGSGHPGSHTPFLARSDDVHRRLLALDAWLGGREDGSAPVSTAQGPVLSPLPVHSRPRARPSVVAVSVVSAPPAVGRVARGVVLDYRRRGVTIRADVASVEAMQRYLRVRFRDGFPDDHEGRVEVFHHGALLSEILVCGLRAVWVDLSPTEVGFWQMAVAPGVTTCPFGRVHRFVALRNRDSDLVEHYLRLAERTVG